MRISDWSSDVCSSDLLHFLGRERGATLPGAVDHELQFVRFRRRGRGLLLCHFLRGLVLAGLRRGHRFASLSMRDRSASRRASRLSWSNAVLSGSLMRNTSSADWKSVVWGRSVSVCVDLSGRVYINKKYTADVGCFDDN